jgi:hypothetical protein
MVDLGLATICKIVTFFYTPVQGQAGVRGLDDGQ